MALNASILRRSSSNFPSRNGSESGQSTSWHVEGIIGDPQIRQANEAYARMLPATSFLKWRPTYHLMASHAWMNGPCAPGYDPTTGLYHLSFQWNPRNNRWGHITWGHATSKDLMTWDISSSPSMEPKAPYDQKGIFTGCMRPTGVDGRSGTLTVFYTSVNRLPIHYTIPYHRGSETLSIAKSEDGGKTWLKSPLNPILASPPPDLDICGWRDPFITPWPSLERLLDRTTGENLYGLLSGGIRNQTPTIFVYSINPSNLAEWTYICPLINLGLNHHVSRWSGDKGKNWDAANLISLSDATGAELDFIITGAEGCPPSPESNPPSHAHQVHRTPHSQQWLSGTLSSSFRPETDARQVHLNYRFGGTFDHGCLYAANSFLCPQSRTHLLWGWITEEDLPQTFMDSQNWSGLLSLPREIRLLRYERVKSALVTPLNDISCFDIEPDVDSTYVVRTLGIVPAKVVEGLRSNARAVELEELGVLKRRRDEDEGSTLDVQTARWELLCEIKVGERCGRVGFVISHTPGKNHLHFSYSSLAFPDVVAIKFPCSLYLPIRSFVSRTILFYRSSKHHQLLS
jgi:beta-fructofuranosidase